MKKWVTEFSGYRHLVNEARVDRWLNQFDTDDRDLGARCLDAVDFVSGEQITAFYRDAYRQLRQRYRHEKRATWRFVPFSGSAGESGDTMLHRFRQANNLAGKNHDSQFVYRSELLQQGLASGDKIVFVDDLAATGDQVSNAWPTVNELVPSGPELFLVLLAATRAAKQRIERETRMEVVAGFELVDRDNFFHHSCDYFSDQEKATALRYCKKADAQRPKGYGDAGLLLVFAHTCPNSSIPILRAVGKEWEGLFRRYD